MRIPFSLINSSAGVWLPASDALSSWLRPELLSGTGATLLWPGETSAGTSAAQDFAHCTVDEVEQPSTALDGIVSAYWHTTAGMPQLDTSASGKILRTDFLGQGDEIGASYTCAYVIQPLSSTRFNVPLGLTGLSNPSVLGENGAYLSHALMDDAGTCKVGVGHYDWTLAANTGSVPLVWPGGFGVWGLMWVVYTLGTSTVKVRIKTAGNAAIEQSDVVAIPRIPTAFQSRAIIGSTGGGVLEMRMCEMMTWAGQALSPAEIATREAYFKSRYPSLGL